MSFYPFLMVISQESHYFFLVSQFHMAFVMHNFQARSSIKIMCIIWFQRAYNHLFKSVDKYVLSCALLSNNNLSLKILLNALVCE